LVAQIFFPSALTLANAFTPKAKQKNILNLPKHKIELMGGEMAT
jgi:hypothetical protein